MFIFYFRWEDESFNVRAGRQNREGDNFMYYQIECSISWSLRTFVDLGLRDLFLPQCMELRTG